MNIDYLDGKRHLPALLILAMALGFGAGCGLLGLVDEFALSMGGFGPGGAALLGFGLCWIGLGSIIGAWGTVSDNASVRYAVSVASVCALTLSLALAWTGGRGTFPGIPAPEIFEFSDMITHSALIPALPCLCLGLVFTALWSLAERGRNERGFGSLVFSMACLGAVAGGLFYHFLSYFMGPLTAVASACVALVLASGLTLMLTGNREAYGPWIACGVVLVLLLSLLVFQRDVEQAILGPALKRLAPAVEAIDADGAWIWAGGMAALVLGLGLFPARGTAVLLSSALASGLVMVCVAGLVFDFERHGHGLHAGLAPVLAALMAGLAFGSWLGGMGRLKKEIGTRTLAMVQIVLCLVPGTMIPLLAAVDTSAGGPLSVYVSLALGMGILGGVHFATGLRVASGVKSTGPGLGGAVCGFVLLGASLAVLGASLVIIPGLGLFPALAMAASIVAAGALGLFCRL